MKKILPAAEPVIKARYNYAVPLTILGSRNQFLPWLYSHYIDLHFLRKDDYTSFNFAGSEFPDPMQQEGIFTHFLQYRATRRSAAAGDIVNYLIERINANNYVYTAFNKFHIPRTFYYRRTYFHHPLLVHGYCTERRIFCIYTFNEHFVYSGSEVSFEQMSDAFEHVNVEELSDSYSTIRQFQFLPDRSYTFRIDPIIRQIDRFIHPPRTASGSATGRSVYPIILSHIERLLSDRVDSTERRRTMFLTRKNLQLMLEHSQLMLMRINYLINHHGILNNEHVLYQQNLIQEIEIMRSLFIKYYRRPKDAYLVGILRALEQFAGIQIDVLTSIRDGLLLHCQRTGSG